jgi:hypothetical protein
MQRADQVIEWLKTLCHPPPPEPINYGGPALYFHHRTL